MANFHPNLTSRSRENVYIKKLSLKFWRTTQKKSGKLRKNAESLPFIKSNVFTAFQIISSSGTLTKKILNLNLHTDGQEEQVKYHWPLESTQISTFSRRKLRYCATPNPQLLRCTAGFQWANVPQSALSRMIIVAWPTFSASRRISQTRFLCLRW